MKNSYKILTGVSHEIRSYMNAIVGLSFLDSYDGDDEKKEISNKVLYACNQVIRLLETYFYCSMIDLGDANVSLKKCRLSSILDNIIPEFRKTLEAAAGTRINLISEINDADPTSVYIDSDKLVIALDCLLHNAANNMESGYIKVGYCFSADIATFYVLGTDQDLVKYREFLYSTDMNVSMTKFYDPRSAVNITLAKKIVQLLGGIISVTSHETKGTGFYLSVPAKTSYDPGDQHYAHNTSGLRFTSDSTERIISI